MKLGFGDRVALDFGDGYTSASAKQTVSDLAAKYGAAIVFDHRRLPERVDVQQLRGREVSHSITLMMPLSDRKICQE